MGSIDFDSEPAYWHEKTMRDSERAGLPTRHRPPINRDEALIAREVRRHLDRIVTPALTVGSPTARAATQLDGVTHICGVCLKPFSRAAWRQRRMWRSIYPRGAGRVDLYRHAVCPRSTGENYHA